MVTMILSQLIVGVFILLIGIGLFFAVNKKLPVEVEGVDPLTGERAFVTRWERGTRRSRWRGYCTILGAVLGYELSGLPYIIHAATHGVTPGNSTAAMEIAPCGMVVGLLAGLALGAVSSQFLPVKTPPLDPDNS